MKPSVSNGVFCILFVAVDKKYAAGGKKHYVKKKPAGGIKKKTLMGTVSPSETAKKNCKGYYGSPRAQCALAMAKSV